MGRKITLIFLFSLICIPPLLSQTHTIYEIQYTMDPSGNSPFVDSVVTVRGIATVSQGIFSAREYYIQDGEGPWNGIMIYDTDTTRGILEGDYVELTGTVSEYYEKTEIGYLDSVRVISQGNEVPQPFLVQTGEIDTTEAYEGVFIHVSHVVVTDPNIGYGEWLIDDGSGECRVDDLANYSYTPGLDDTIMHLLGIVDYAYDDFKIEPRGDRDIIFTLDGTGVGFVFPDTIPNGYNLSEDIVVLASVDTLRMYSITVPFQWQWTGNLSDVVLSGTGNSGAVSAVTGTGSVADPYVITVTSAQPTETDSAVVTIQNLVSSDSVGSDTFLIMTAGVGGTLIPIPVQPVVTILSSDGSGTVTVVPDEVVADSMIDLDFQLENNFGVVEKVEMNFTFDWQWSGNSQDVVLSGDAFSNAQITVYPDSTLPLPGWVISLDSTTLEPGGNGVLTINSIRAPDSLDFFTFAISTGGPGGNLLPISENPVVLVRRSDGTIPIIAVDRNDSDGIPSLLGDYVRIKGVVTAADEFGDQTYIQDRTGGVCVYGISSYLALGDTVTVSGTVYQYYGLTELSPSTFEQFHGRGGFVPPETLTCYDITSDGIGGIEKYEGELVLIRGVTTNALTFPSEGNIVISDSTGNCEVRIKEETGLGGADTPDSTFDIVGIVSQYRYNSPYISGYQVMPRGFSDIRMGGDGSGRAEIHPGFVNGKDTSFIEITISGGLDTLETIVVTLPLEWYWTGSGSDVTLAGEGFLSATVDSVTGDGITKPFEIEITGGCIIPDADGIVTINNVSPEGNMGRWEFPIETAVPGGFKKKIYEYPSVWSVNKIFTVQEPGSDGYTSGMEGDSVFIAGTVTGPSASFSSSTFNSFYIQDETGGVNIYSGEGRMFDLSEMVIVKGIVTEYNGLTEVSTDPEAISLLEDTAHVSPSLLSLNQGIDENLEGRLVRVENGNVITNPSVAGTGRNFQIYNGRTIIDVRVNDDAGIDLVGIEVGKRINVNGIAGQYDSESPYNSGYQLLPRFTSDIEIRTQGGEPGSFSLFVYPNPFSPDRGEIATIEVTSPDPLNDRLTLKIFDLKGRVVKIVFSNVPGGSSVYYWDGRDRNLRDVPVGIYIVHLEMRRGDGTVESINKAVVIGTPKN